MVEVDEFNRMLAYALKYKCVIDRPYNPDAGDVIGPLKAYIEDHMTLIYLTMKYQNKVTTFGTRKDGPLGFVNDMTGTKAYRMLRRMCKFHVFKADDIVLGKPYNVSGDEVHDKLAHMDAISLYSASPILYYKKDENLTRQHAYGYDINSAYSSAMLECMPDTSKTPSYFRTVEWNELGFTTIDGFSMVEPGHYAEIIYPAKPSPFRKFVEYYYNLKKSAKNDKEKQYYKNVLNYAVGALQHHNLFLRAAIIGHCNNRIKKIIEMHPNDIISCNTDSIVSKVPLPELAIGTKLGEWKLEHDGDFALKGNNYQWNKEKPKYRGIPTAYFKDDYDILSDPLPGVRNIYELDKKTYQLKEVVYGKKEKNLS